MENAKTSTTMAVVLKDEAGDYFLLPQEMLEGIRVPAEHKAQIEDLITEQQSVQGYMLHALATPAAVITVGAVLITAEILSQRGYVLNGIRRALQ